MNNQQYNIGKPQKRSSLRKKLGKAYFIKRRQIQWMFAKNHFAKARPQTHFNHVLIKHQSLLLRPLKDVDMYLQHNKITNLRIAISHLHQTVIHPGEVFSIWKQVGRPTKKKGYLDGLILHNGQISKGTGGGLCQLGNLLYWMALHTPLTIKERWRHSYDVFPDVNRTIPFACGATLSYNYVDLQLQNNTDYSFQINLFLDDEYLHGEITCNTTLSCQYNIFETDHLFKQQWWGGYTRHNKIWRKITHLEEDSTITELVSENHAIMMYSPMLGEHTEPKNV